MTISCKENVFNLDPIKYQKKYYSGVMDFYASKLYSTSKSIGKYSFMDTWCTGYPMTTKKLWTKPKGHRQQNDFQSGGPRFLKSQMVRQRQLSCLRDVGECLRGDVAPSEVGAFFENGVLNEAILCTIFHQVDHLTGGNWQKWKRVFLTCHCHKIYRDEAVGLKSCKNTWKITIFVKMWNLGQYCENLIFCQ